MDKPTLYIFAGLPGSGKTTLARALGKAFGAPYLRIDTIEQGLRDLCRFKVEGEGYRLAYRLAADNLSLGNNVIADSCNPIELTRREWNEVAANAGAKSINIEVICSDKAEHKHRINARKSTIEGLKQPNWEQVENREYHQWHNDRLVIDTAGKSIQDCVNELLNHLVNDLSL